MTQLFSRLRGFLKSESGAPTVEFVILFPLFTAILAAGLELGVIMVRQTMLERGLDIAMREVRLNTGKAVTHDQLRTLVCEGASIEAGCESNMRLEMFPTSPRDYRRLPDTVDCVHHAQGSTDVVNTHREVTGGAANELVIVRACLLYKPVFPTSRLVTFKRDKDRNGRSALVAVSAFTQEPR